MTGGASTTLAAAIPLESVLSVASAVLAGIATAASAWVATAARLQTRAAVERVDATSPDEVLSSLDLDALGDYVYETLGAIPISEYASDGTARRNVRSALREIQRFVVEDEGAIPAAEVEEGIDTSSVRALDAIGQGDTWQALARLRRAIEIELRSRAKHHDVEVPQRAGAGRVLQALVRAQAIPEQNAALLRHAIDVANRAVHGDPVSVGEAEDAVYAADAALRSGPI